MARKHVVDVNCEVEVKISDELLALIVEREKVDPTYRELQSRDGVLSHLAYNAVANGVTDATRLDGFADLERGSVTMHVLLSSVEIEVAREAQNG